MKNKISLLFALLCASMMSWATDYCHTEMSAGGKTIYLTCQEVSTGNYQLKVECNETMSGLGGSFCEVNGVGGYQLNAAGHFTLSADGKTITCDIESSTAPRVYTPLYVLIDGEKNFGEISDASWAACGGDPTPPTMISATKASQTYNTVVINVAADDNVGVTKYVIKNHSDDSEVGEYTPAAGQITVEGLTPETAYDWDVYAKDAAGNVSVAGINVTFTTDAAPSNIYCAYEIGHEGNPSADLNSFILLSVGSDGNGHTIVNVKQDDAKNSAMFDYINIVGKKDIGADVATGGSDEMAIVFPTPTPDGDGNIALDIQWSTINWGGRWQCHVELPADATCATADPFPGDNTYCSYTDNQLRANNANVALTWGTDGSGNVIVDISDGEGATNTAFRNGGFENEGSFAATWFVYSGTNHTTCEPATTYFNNGGTLSNENKRFTLTKKANLPANAVIAFFGHAFSWRTDQATGAYHEKKYFGYQYGYNCPILSAPTNVAVDGSKVITFDAVANAETYTAKVYLDGILKHQQVVASGDVLSFTPYTTGTYQVQVVADAAGYPTSEPSTAYDWALTAPAIVVGNSEYCEYAIGSNNTSAAITWETSDEGAIVISIAETLGGDANATHFRGTGMNIANFQVGEARTAASAYFNHACGGSNQVTLTLKDVNIKPGLGEKIYYTNKVVEWATSKDNNAYSNLTFEYTYGSKCSGQKHVTVSVNNNEMGSATVDGVAAKDVDEGTQVTCVAVPASGYEFVNWTKGGVEVSTDLTYTPTINTATDLVANFDYARTTYCHQPVTTNGGKKLYLTVGKGATEGTYQIKIYGSEELTITGINNANTAVNHIKYLTYDGNDVPLTIANGGWSFEAIGYGVISSAEIQPQTNHTWRDIWMWRPDLYIGTSAGEQNINAVLNQQNYFNWNSTCSDAEAPVFDKAEAEVLSETSVQLKIQATDNWGGVLTYTIARAGAEPIISNHASGEEFTQDVTGLTAGTQYDFTVTVSDGVNNANTHILVTPEGDNTKPTMGTASLESKTWHSAIINVAATDNKGVTAYYVVEKDADYVAAEGKITVDGLTASTEYTLHIKAKDAAGNISDNQAEVSFTTDAHSLVPTTAAPVPTWPDDQVKSLYSDTYELAPANKPNYNAPWWSAPAITLGEIDGNHYMDYNLANDGMIGWQYDQISIASMEKLHIDIFASAAGTVSVRPITDGDGTLNDNRKSLTLAAQQWNSFDIDLTEFGAHDWTKLFQFSIEYWAAGGLLGEHISVDNVYFYRTSAIVDTEAPTNVNANVARASFGSITLNVSGEDNSGTVLYSIKIGDTEYANGAANSGASKQFTLNGLAQGTNYSISVIASDESDNVADPVIVVAQTSAITPAPVPTHNSAFVRSVYCDAYETALAHDFLKNTWTGIPYSELSLGSDHVLAYTNPNSPNQMPDIAWGVNNDGPDAIIAKDGFNDGTNMGLDVRNMQYIHFDIWSSVATTYPELRLNDTPAGHIELDGSGWQSFDLDISSLTDAQKSNIRWIKFIAFRDPAPEDIVIDNVYFWSYGASTTPVMGGDAETGGWATFSCAEKVAVPTGVTAYKAVYEKTATEEVMNLSSIGNVIPAGEGVILKGAAGTAYAFSVTTEDAPTITDNALVGCPVRTDITSVLVDNDVFCLRYSELYSLTGFFLYTGQYVPAGKAYLALPKATPGAGSTTDRRLRFVINDSQVTTAITGAETENTKITKFVENGQLFIRRGDTVYTIQGMRVK